MKNKKYIVVNRFSYKDFPNLVRECLSKPSIDQCNQLAWKKLTDKFNDTVVKNKNNNNMTVLHSVESYAGIPKTNTTITLMRNLLQTYNIKVILVDRPVYSWFLSFYYQCRKGNHYDTSRRKWRDFPNYETLGGPDAFSDQLTISEYFNKYYFRLRDSLESYKVYKDIFGAGSITPLDMYASHGLAVEFLCNGLGNATHVCNYIRASEANNNKNPKGNSNDGFLFGR